MQRLFSLIKKEFIQTFRDKNMMRLILIIPIIQTIILGYAISNELRNQSLQIVDLDRSTQSRQLINIINQSEHFKIKSILYSEDELYHNIRLWKVNSGLIIPKGFAEDLINQKTPQFNIVLDAVDGNSAGLSIQYLSQIINLYIQNLTPEAPAVQINERYWYNPNLKPYQYMVPGIVAVLVTMISILLSSMSLVREKEMGTLEQLMVSPIKKWELITGKLVPILVLSFFEFYFALFVGQLVFGIQMQGSYLIISILTLIYFFTTLGLGVSISVISATQQQAMFFSWFCMLFMTLLSGLFMPIDNMPDIIKAITYLNPMAYFVNIMREVFQKANTIQYLYKDGLLLCLYGFVVFTFSIIRFQKRIS